MDFELDPEVINKGQAMAKLLDSNELLRIVAHSEDNDGVDGISGVGEQPYPENTPMHDMHDMGDLSRLGLDILQEVVEHLDFGSALQFSLVNRYAHQLVERSSLTFIKKWAPSLHRTLWIARIIGYWELWQLKAAIRDGRCASCGDLAKEICVATMVRCCPLCLKHNAAYWCLTKAQTTAAFALPLEEINKIQPVFAPDLYEEGSTSGGWGYPIKHTLSRAIEVHGSIGAVAAAAREICAGKQDPRFADVPKSAILPPLNYDHFRAAQLEPLTWAQATNRSVGTPFREMTTSGGFFRAEIVPRGQTQLITYGCHGCVSYLMYRHGMKINRQERTWLDIGYSYGLLDLHVELSRRAARIRTADHLVDHIRSECLGGWALIYEARRGQMPPVEESDDQAELA
ncbi:hypothetical protein N7535_007726 [Penicillium sp. DV-2018c]|nr:hypothetical protein N7461_003757 [Penicillium sp. DV-2018c]KAJ5566088.1 hypothetical protein N7535_007726 [Penicillium sp. DV-2018c]